MSDIRKMFFSVIVAALAVLSVAADSPVTQPDAASLKIRIAVPQPDWLPLRTDLPNMHVVIENVSASP